MPVILAYLCSLYMLKEYREYVCIMFLMIKYLTLYLVHFKYIFLISWLKLMLTNKLTNKQKPEKLATDIRRKNRLANLNNTVLHGLELHVTHVTTTESTNSDDRTLTWALYTLYLKWHKR